MNWICSVLIKIIWYNSDKLCINRRSKYIVYMFGFYILFVWIKQFQYDMFEWYVKPIHKNCQINSCIMISLWYYFEWKSHRPSKMSRDEFGTNWIVEDEIYIIFIPCNIFIKYTCNRYTPEDKAVYLSGEEIIFTRA